MKKIQLNLGSGIYIRKDFINVDNFFTLEELKEGIKTKKGKYKDARIEKGAEFVKADILHLPFPDNYADYVEAMEVIEHFPMWHILEYMKEIYRVMKPGAKLIIMTNNMTGLCLDWMEMMTQDFDINQYYRVAETIYGNQYGDSEGEYHRCPITPKFLNNVLFQAGFKKGEMWIIPKNALMTKQIGTLPINKKTVARNELLIAEVTK